MNTPPVPNRLTTIADIVELLKYGGHVFQSTFCRTFAIHGNVTVYYGLSQWSVVSITIRRIAAKGKKDRIVMMKIRLYGIDGAVTHKTQDISYTSLSLPEKYCLYDAIRVSVGLTPYFNDK